MKRIQHMKRIQLIWMLIGCGLIYLSCSKPTHIHAGGDIDELGPLVQEVRLVDTISPSFISDLHLEGTMGNAFRYPSGNLVSYFAYVAEADKVLMAISKLPFPMRDRSADVNYHEVSGDEWNALRRTVGLYELSGANFFWDVDPEQYNIYASQKNEHHLLLVRKGSGQIMHRIANKT